MRSLKALALATTFAACTSNGMMGGDDGEGSGSGSGSGTLQPPARGFQVKTPEVTIHAHEEITYCYYFKTSNTEAMAMKKWSSAWTAGSHHVILYFASGNLPKPEGTIEAGSCGFGGGSLNIPQWIYSAQVSPSNMELPSDDGTGKPLSIDVPANQNAMLEVHYNNTNDDDVVSTATVNAEAYDAGTVTTKTFAYVTYLGNFEIPASQTPTTLTNECAISPQSKVWLMSTHVHKNAIKTRVLDGDESSTNVVFESLDWEHPGAKRMDNPFYQFASGKLTDECTWMNTTGQPIQEGSSAKTEEMCMASGYYFPATKATFCYNGYVL